jgi:hypothetical protein
MPCRMINNYGRAFIFKDTQSNHPYLYNMPIPTNVATLLKLFYPEYEGIMIFRNVGDNSTDHMASSSTSWLLKMGPICCPETSVQNYQSTLRNIPEERRSNLHRGGSLKSRTWCNIPQDLNRLVAVRTSNLVYTMSYYYYNHNTKHKENVPRLWT